jgi:hypothetical protein
MDTAVLWKLYDNEGYDDQYKSMRARDGIEIGKSVKQIFNPAPEIIDMDIALITKGLKIVSETKDAENLQDINDWDYILDKYVLYGLLDGKSYLEIVRKDREEVFFIPLSVSEVTQTEYDEGGNIISADIQYNNNDVMVQKHYDMEVIETTIDSETISVPNTWGFIPLVEYIGHKGKDDKCVSRIRGLPPILDEINAMTADIKAIINLHADPIAWGDVNIDVDEHAEQEEERAAAVDEGSRSVRFMTVPEGGNLNFLEMQGNIAKLAKEERDTLLEELRDKFPETLLAKIAAGSGVSGFAVKLKLSGLLSIIEKFRSSLVAALKKSMKYALEMAGYDKEQKFFIKLESPLPENTVEDVSIMIQAYASGLLPLETAAHRIAELLRLDADLVVELLKKQEMLLNEFDNATNDKEFQSYNQPGMRPKVSEAVSEINNRE